MYPCGGTEMALTPRRGYWPEGGSECWPWALRPWRHGNVGLWAKLRHHRLRMMRRSTILGLLAVAALVAWGAPKAAAKWEGPWVSLGLGGKVKTTIYYGPWKCRETFITH